MQDSVCLVKVASRRLVTDQVMELSLVAIDGRPLPPWAPGAHIDLHLGDNVRQYSLTGDVGDRDGYAVAVLREPASRGGSAFVHDKLDAGDEIAIAGPRNHFELVDAPTYLFIGGGIGITPIRPMIAQVQQSGHPWRLAYGGRTRSSMAYAGELLSTYPGAVDIYPDDEVGLLDLIAILGPEQPGRAVYACGPEPLLKALEGVMAERRSERLHTERFAPKAVESTGPDEAFRVKLARSQLEVEVPAGVSIIDAVLEAGVDVDFSCREGICGTCETRVLEGIPEHRDSVLDADEQTANDCMMVCISRSRTPTLTLDL